MIYGYFYMFLVLLIDAGIHRVRQTADGGRSQGYALMGLKRVGINDTA